MGRCLAIGVFLLLYSALCLGKHWLGHYWGLVLFVLSLNSGLVVVELARGFSVFLG